MTLRELGTKIKQAVDMVTRATLVDQDTVDDMLKQICNGLIAADVQVKLVVQMRQRMRERIQREFAIPGSSKQKIVRRVCACRIGLTFLTPLTTSMCPRKVVMDELVALVDPQPGQANPKFSPVRGRTNVVMFVGLQGAGKTTTVAKLALQYKRRGWKVAMVCADTFRAGADHQLLQLARSIKVPAYADGSQFDPVVVAREGIDCFKREGCEIILVDTSGRHKQEAQLFEEMEQLAAAVVRPAKFFNSIRHLTTCVYRVSCRVVVLCAAAEAGHGDVRAGWHDRPNGLRPSAGLQGAHSHRFHHCDQARRPRPRRRCPLCVRS